MHILLLPYKNKLMTSLSLSATQTLLEDTVTMQHISNCRAEHTVTLQLLLLKYYA